MNMITDNYSTINELVEVCLHPRSTERFSAVRKSVLQYFANEATSVTVGTCVTEFGSLYLKNNVESLLICEAIGMFLHDFY